MMYDTLLFIPGGPFEIAFILIVLIILFGPSKIPQVAQALGKSLGKFEEGKQKAQKELQDVETNTVETETDADTETETETDAEIEENRD